MLIAFVLEYLLCVETAKWFFFRVPAATTEAPLQRADDRGVHRIAARWSHHGPLPG